MASASDHAVPDQGPRLLAICIVLPTLAYVIFATRVAWRWKSRQWGLDDVMITCAAGMLAIQTAFCVKSVENGFGKHGKDLLPEKRHRALMYFYLLQICYKFLGGFSKLAFLFLYLRIFETRRFQTITKATVAIVIVGSVAFGIATVVQCIPIPRAWNKNVPGTCMNYRAFWYTHSVWNAAFDVWIFAMPIPVIRTLQLPKGQKVGLLSVFALGSFVCAASIIRMTKLDGSSKSPDPTWGSVSATLWTEVESVTSIICACMPALRALLRRWMQRLRGQPLENSVQKSYGLEGLSSSRGMDKSRPYQTDGTWYDAVAEQSHKGHNKSSSSPMGSQERIFGITKVTDISVTHAVPSDKDSDQELDGDKIPHAR